MKKNSIILITIALLTAALIYYWYVPVEPKLIEIARINTDGELSGTWWTTVFSEEHSITRKYNIKLPDINYSKNNLIVSGGREIKILTYTRNSKFKLPYKKKHYVGEAILKNEFYPHTLFVYKIDKIPIKYDDIGWPDVKIED